MLIRNRKAFNRGLLLLISFLVVFFVFFMPIFPTHEGGTSNGLVFADNLFNTLSKGSANFFAADGINNDTVERRIEPIRGNVIDLTITFKDTAQMPLATKLAQAGGMQVEINGDKMTLKGDLHTFLTEMIADAFTMYHNDSDSIAKRHGETDGRLVMRTWWQLGTNMVRPLQAKLLVPEANAVSNVLSRGVEPAYNFYGIQALRVRDNVPLVAGFLIFYVIYTMWYGFAIFDIFEGIGLTMKKGVKKEV